MTTDKEKQKEGTVQDKVLLYKPYNISISSSSEISSLGYLVNTR